MTLGWIGLCRSSPCCLPALQSCYALLNQHILCRLMNDRCFIHEGKIVYILWSTFQVLWREQSTEADGLKGMKIDWIHYFSRSCLQMKRWFWQSVDVWVFYLSKPIPSKLCPHLCHETPASQCILHIIAGALAGSLTERVTVTRPADFSSLGILW